MLFRSRFFGGDLMADVGGARVKHYKELAYMGFIPVLLHLKTIFRNMALCKRDIVEIRINGLFFFIKTLSCNLFAAKIM